MTESKINKGIIYALICNIDKKFYIGSTNSTINKCFSDHKYKAKRQYSNNNSKIYLHFKKYKIDNWSIKELMIMNDCTRKELENCKDEFIKRCLDDDKKKILLLNTTIP